MGEDQGHWPPAETVRGGPEYLLAPSLKFKKKVSESERREIERPDDGAANFQGHISWVAVKIQA